MYLRQLALFNLYPFSAMRHVNIIYILLISVFLVSCKKDRHDEELNLQQIPYSGNELRIDGFYYQTIESTNSTKVFFLYSNGIILGGFNYPGSNWESTLIEDVISGEYHNTSVRYKSSWGLYQIQDSTIIFEKWYSASPGWHEAFAREGTILNDTTFLIERAFKFENGGRTNVREREELFRFREFSPKPSSANPFIP
jgi:hypothetical protein